MARPTAEKAQDILMSDFQTLVADTEKLLAHTASLAGEQADELREQIRESLLRARETLKLTARKRSSSLRTMFRTIHGNR
jgi:ElaB/YqjD/DUF883 family membrane-anchored ribosome-binding protein